MSAAIRLERLACIRGGRLLFEGIDLALGDGDAALVTGPNGAGKSSLLRIAAGLLPPAAGSVAAEGGVAWLGEQPALDAHLPLGKALAYWAAIDGASPGATEAALEALDIAALADVPVRMLSTGQRKRAGLARVALSGAAIWLLDEPANGLDTATVARLEHLIANHRARGGIALVATHQPVALPGAMTIVLEKRA